MFFEFLDARDKETAEFVLLMLLDCQMRPTSLSLLSLFNDILMKLPHSGRAVLLDTVSFSLGYVLVLLRQLKGEWVVRSRVFVFF